MKKKEKQQLIKLMEKEYKKAYKDCSFSKIATTVHSDKHIECYSGLLHRDYYIMNRDFEATLTTTIKDKKDLETRVKTLAKTLTKETIEFQDELIFTLLDQSYSPIGSYGYWKYRESFNKDSFRFEPQSCINESGKLIGFDGMPLFGTHIDRENQKICNNILHEKLTLRSYKKAKKLLITQNKIKNKSNKFLLIVGPEREWIAKDLITKKLKKDEKCNLLVADYFKNLKWALMLERKESKPLIFQLRQNPSFEVIDSNETGTLSEKEVALCTDMRGNAGINNWKQIVGCFEEREDNLSTFAEEDFSTLRIWTDVRRPKKHE